jgi:hypothetical protein
LHEPILKNLSGNGASLANSGREGKFNAAAQQPGLKIRLRRRWGILS